MVIGPLLMLLARDTVQVAHCLVLRILQGKMSDCVLLTCHLLNLFTCVVMPVVVIFTLQLGPSRSHDIIWPHFVITWSWNYHCFLPSGSSQFHVSPGLVHCVLDEAGLLHAGQLVVQNKLSNTCTCTWRARWINFSCLIATSEVF